MKSWSNYRILWWNATGFVKILCWYPQHNKSLQIFVMGVTSKFTMGYTPTTFGLHCRWPYKAIFCATHLKCPSELLFGVVARGHVGGQHELLEVDGAVSILVKDPEDLIHKYWGLFKGQNHPINLQDLVLAQNATWTIVLEAFVPFPKQVVTLFWAQPKHLTFFIQFTIQWSPDLTNRSGPG